ncbi:MAG TPA: protease [Candidatus Omnitrophica bacterium]|nr:MAG: protease [Omnitrophica WOR_2 bacterium GWA2_53_43]HBO96504.1 protease [Candidatus Omnitrophota bacterium]HCI44329.1 protease [Candidatus Omnitrophota bacterium]
MSAGKKKTIAILVEDMYQVLEVWYPVLRLKEDGIETKLVGTGNKTSYGSKEGYPAEVGCSIDQVSAKDFDGVIIPGGFAPDFLRRYEKVIMFVRQMHDDGKIVAAICHGGWLLVSADIIRGREVTCFFAIKDDLKAAGGHYVDQEVVVDKNIITSRKPEDLTAFVLEIIKKVKDAKK